jgi:hypothetical protein
MKVLTLDKVNPTTLFPHDMANDLAAKLNADPEDDFFYMAEKTNSEYSRVNIIDEDGIVAGCL